MVCGEIVKALIWAQVNPRYPEQHCRLWLHMVIFGKLILLWGAGGKHIQLWPNAEMGLCDEEDVWCLNAANLSASCSESAWLCRSAQQRLSGLGWLSGSLL